MRTGPLTKMCAARAPLGTTNAGWDVGVAQVVSRAVCIPIRSRKRVYDAKHRLPAHKYRRSATYGLDDEPPPLRSIPGRGQPSGAYVHGGDFVVQKPVYVAVCTGQKHDEFSSLKLG